MCFSACSRFSSIESSMICAVVIFILLPSDSVNSCTLVFQSRTSLSVYRFSVKAMISWAQKAIFSQPLANPSKMLSPPLPKRRKT